VDTLIASPRSGVCGFPYGSGLLVAHLATGRSPRTQSGIEPLDLNMEVANGANIDHSDPR